MARRIRILIVDDAVVIRRLLTDILSSDPQIEVVGTAANGRIALSKVEQTSPDLVTLDIEMPEMDGLQTLAEIRKARPLLPVIMFSTLTERGAAKTLEALALGASDYITKPANIGSVSLAIERIRGELIPRIKAFCQRAAGLESSTPLPGPLLAALPPPAASAKRTISPVQIVAIGVSTGGPNALAAVFPQFPENFPVPIVVVQHMPPVFTKILAERLDSNSAVRVHEGAPGDCLQQGHAWIAPGGSHMVIERNAFGAVIQTNLDAPENSCRPAVDVLFRSVLRVYGGATLAVILTGMGQDGFRGCEELRKAGAQILAQDEASSVVWGMPGFVARAGLADRVVPLDQVGAEITRRVLAGRKQLPALAG
jgi:two-component system, chemotaxis family, protein-glutamate methylesterase/glutaminase